MGWYLPLNKIAFATYFCEKHYLTSFFLSPFFFPLRSWWIDLILGKILSIVKNPKRKFQLLNCKSCYVFLFNHKIFLLFLWTLDKYTLNKLGYSGYFALTFQKDGGIAVLFPYYIILLQRFANRWTLSIISIGKLTNIDKSSHDIFYICIRLWVI